MSKIVCDVCGSSYSDSETQCPICGTAKSAAAKPVVETTKEEQPKSGKYSQTNTKKTASSATRQSSADKNRKKKQETPSNLAMIIIVAVLLLAIVVVGVCIAVRAFGNNEGNETTSTSASTSGEVVDVPCTGIELVSEDSLSFTGLDQSAQISVRALPTNTTDEVSFTYESSDEAVVLVDSTGKVTPVADGTATITVKCGEFTAEVAVTCALEYTLELDHADVTLNATSSTVTLYSGKIDAANITWTSSDETVATVENGVVTAVADGKATITATYGEQVQTCIVYVSGMEVSAAYAIRGKWSTSADVTLTVDESLQVYLYNVETGDAVTEGVTWTFSADFSKCCSYVENDTGLTLTATASTASVSNNKVYVYATYEGETYEFIVRVKAAE